MKIKNSIHLPVYHLWKEKIPAEITEDLPSMEGGNVKRIYK